MLRRSIFVIALTVVVLYFSLILFMLTPLHGARSVLFKNNYINQLTQRRVPPINWCKDLRWRSPPTSDVVALVSFPGSGNTWLRYLLQQVTGIATGSIYMDYGLRDHGFPAENVTDGSVLVVKTHEGPPLEPKKFKAAVLLIRNPRDAILADFNRVHKGHIGTAPLSAFKRKSKYMNKTEWEAYFWSQIRAWRALHHLWLRVFPGRVLVIQYEVLLVDTKTSLLNILEFLNVTVSEEDMSCVLGNKEGIYRRRKKIENFDPFTPEMYEEINRVRSQILSLVNDYNNKIKLA